MRLIRRPWLSGEKPTQIRRIYLFHNGLNETDYLSFYYALADGLLDDESAFLIRPFPGHLTRYPLASDYCERPLDRYLSDAGELFRQFLRFMIETQWLLSILVPLRSYRVVSGLDLLAEGDEKDEGRQDPKKLAEIIYTHWQLLFNASESANRNAGEAVTEEAILGSIKTIRTLMGWQPVVIDLAVPPERNHLLPTLHAIGYSLGGFLAQSVFFTWPFVISSCTTLSSGGALRQVAPKAFAHPEEWQTVMYALPFERESAMLDGRLGRSHDRKSIAGLKVDYYSFFSYIFSEVFLRDSLNAYKTRVSEFVRRLLFIVGGNDPVIPIGSLIDASPVGGINMIQIADLSHFLALDLRDNREWREFWLPRLADITAAFSDRAEIILAETLHKNWWNKDRTIVLPMEEKTTASSSSRPSRQRTSRPRDLVDLPAPQYAEELESMVTDLLAKDGWLFILRNQVPVALRGPWLVHQRGVLHREDDHIREYIEGLKRRGEQLTAHRDKVTLVIPERLKDWFTRDTALLSAKGETVSIPTPETLSKIWDYFCLNWKDKNGALREFRPGITIPTTLPDVFQAFYNKVREKLEVPSGHAFVNTLPDVWIAFSNKALIDLLSYRDLSRQNVEFMFVDWANTIFSSGRNAIHRIMRESLPSENLRVIKMSAAEFNPRFMGHRIRDSRVVERLIVHSALAYVHSEPV